MFGVFQIRIYLFIIKTGVEIEVITMSQTIIQKILKRFVGPVMEKNTQKTELIIQVEMIDSSIIIKYLIVICKIFLFIILLPFIFLIRCNNQDCEICRS